MAHKKINILFVCGARPNFMKIAPLMESFKTEPSINSSLVHTGQHYDEKLSKVFFDELGIPNPDFVFKNTSGTHAEQTAKMLIQFEELFTRHIQQGSPFDWVFVVGDVNSSLAAALAASKLGISIAHVEAGLRSHDKGMPEEINRIVIDSLSKLFFCTEPNGVENLRHEGQPDEQIFLVGNVMIDSLRRSQPKAKTSSIHERLGIEKHNYAVTTLHRPANVDNPKQLSRIVKSLIQVSKMIPIIFPIHPRTQARLHELGLKKELDQSALNIIQPLGFIDFLSLTSQARLVLTDSGGLQEESSALGIKCYTLRTNTERPITIEKGTNELVGERIDELPGLIKAFLSDTNQKVQSLELWDGNAAERIKKIFVEYESSRRKAA